MQGQDIRVNLAFTANTQQAKAQIKDLTKTFNELTNVTTKEISINGLNKELVKGQEAAFKLKTMIEQATNVDTGRLDLSKMNQALKNSGTTLKKLGVELGNLGPEGVKAFGQIASAIANAEVPLKRTNKALDRLWVSFKNTATWMFTSNVLQGFTSSISSALNYAEDLNGTLNDIRIVTGKNIDEMAKFAVEANKAAKALSTTTNEYSKASLIYFQQGNFTNEEIARRTEITVKLANVTGESTKEISNQLTAIWNNFEDGGKSLEYYADVVTALGAATASSSKEISDGLDKFAAIAKTVGLSYEYAASALATVTATTRQSADVVGTAFKTLFARIQDLELGKTLDDGTSLGQYSQALASVGINIKNTNGEVKDMNTLLDEMGAKWDSLSKTQQVALAQNVAGVRQYSQLIALMDNWDFFQKNLETSLSAEGTLQNQADIYAESWEAAKKEVQASAEAIYSALINDEFFIDVTKMAAKLLDTLKEIIDVMGGAPGILGAIAAIIPKLFGNQILSGIHSLWSNFSSESKQMIKEAQALKLGAMSQAASAYGDVNDPKHQAYNDSQNTIYNSQKDLKESIFNISRNLTEEEIKQIELIEREAKVWDEILLKLAEKKDLLAEQTEELDEQKNKLEKNQKYLEQQKNNAWQKINSQTQIKLSTKKDSRLNKAQAGSVAKNLDLEQIRESLKNQKFNINIPLSVAVEDLSEAELQDIKNKLIKEGEQAAQELQKTFEEALKAGKIDQDTYNSLQEYLKTSTQLEQNERQLVETNKKLKTSQDNLTDAQKRVNDAADKVSESYANAKAQIESFNSSATKLGQNVMDIVSGLGQIAMGINMLESAVNIFNDDNLSGWEKFLKLITTVSMALPALGSGLASVKKAFDAGIISQTKDVISKGLQIAATKGAAAAARANAQAKREEKQTTDASTQSSIKNAIVEKASKIGNGVKKGWSKGWGDLKQGWNNTKTNWNNSAWDALDGKTQNEMLEKAMEDKGYSRYRPDGKKLPKNQFQDASGNKVSRKEAIDVSGVKGQAGKNSLKGLGKSAGYAALTAAVVAAAIAAGKAIYNAADEAYNRDARAAQRAEKAALELANAYGEAKSKYESLNNIMKSYKDGVKGLEELKEGTLEYSEAVSAANDHAIELINTYPELSGQYTIAANGLIEFNQGVLENVKLLELQRKNAAATAATIAKYDAKEARSKSDMTDFLREDIKSNERSEWTTEDTAKVGMGTGIGLGAGAAVGVGIVAGLKGGAAVGTVAGPIGAAIGAVVGVLAGATIGVISAAADAKEATEREQKAIEALSKAYDKQGKAALTSDQMRKILSEEGITDPNLINSLDRNSDQLEKLLAEMKANTEARRQENILLAREQATSEDVSFQSLEGGIQDAISTFFGNERTQQSEDIKYDKYDYSKGQWFFGRRASAEGKKQFAAWAEDQGLKNATYKNFSGDHIKYQYYDEEQGKMVTKDLTYEQLAAWQEGKEISAQQSDAYKRVRESMINIANKQGGDAILGIIGEEDINNYTQAQFDDLIAAYNDPEMRQKLIELGDQNGQNYIEAVEKAIDNWDAEKALNRYITKVQSEIDSILTEAATKTGLSAGAIDGLAGALLNASAALKGAATEWEAWDNKKTATTMAARVAGFATGVKTLNKELGESSSILYEWNEYSTDTWEAVSKVQDALESALGVRPSADFIKNNLEDIQRLAQGDTTALEKLRDAATEDFIINLAISDNTEGDLLAFINQFENEINKIINNNGITLEAGVSFDAENFVTQFNEFLKTSNLTQEQIESMFAAKGYTVDLQTMKVEVSDGKGGYNVEDRFYIANSKTDNQTGVEAKDVKNQNSSLEVTRSGTGLTYIGNENDAKKWLADLHKEAKKRIAEMRKEIEDDVDVYHEEEKALENLERALNNTAKAKDRAWGSKKLAYIDQEIDLLDQQIKKTEELLKLKRQEASESRTQLASNYGFTFDVDGTIANYEIIYTAMRDRYDALMKEAILTNNVEWQNQLNDWYEAFKKDTEDYESLLKETQDLTDSAEESAQEKRDKALEKIEYKVELRVEVNEGELKVLERMFKRLDDPIQEGLAMIENFAQRIESSEKLFDGYKQGIAELLGPQVLNIDFTSKDAVQQIQDLISSKNLNEAEMNALQEYIDGMGDAVDSMEEFYEEAFGVISSAFEKIKEEAQEATDTIEHLTSMIDTYQNVIDLVGAKTLKVSNDTLRQLSAARVASAKSTLEVAKSDLKAQQEALQKFQQAYNQATTEEDKKHWKDLIDETTKSVREAEQTLNNAWTGALEAAAEDFKTAVDITMNEFEAAMTGIYGTFDKMSQAYEQQKEISELYLADYQKVYELSKLNRDITASLDSTDSIKGKQILLELQKEINDLEKSGVKMSQYDLDYLRKKYDLRLAEIALEESQSAKTTVRMRRDLEGNWSYVYTAEQDKINDARQNYEDQLYNMMDFNQKYLDENEAKVIANWSRMSERIRQLNIQDFESYSDYLEELQRIKREHTEIHNALVGEMDKAANNSKILYQEDWKTYSGFTNEKINEDKRLRLAFSDTFIAITNGYADVNQARENFDENFSNTVSQLTDTYKTWKTNVNGIFKAVDEEMYEFGKNLPTEILEITNKIDEVGTAFSNWKTDAQSGLNNLINYFNQSAVLKSFSDSLQPYIKIVKGLMDGLNSVKNSDFNATTPEYFGTFKGKGGTTYRTSKSYLSEQAAREGAASESAAYWESLEAQAKEEAAQGNRSFLDSYNEHYQNYGSSGTGFTTDKKIATAPPVETTSSRVFEFQDSSGGTQYISDQTIATNGLYQGSSGDYFIKNNRDQIYQINEETFKEAQTFFGQRGSSISAGYQNGNNLSRYHGYFKDLQGNLHRTVASYKEQSEAKDAIPFAVEQYAKNIINEHQYQRALGKTDEETPYADSEWKDIYDDIISQGEFSTGQVIENQVLADNIGNHNNVMSVKDSQGRTQYILKDQLKNIHWSSRRGQYYLSRNEGKSIVYLDSDQVYELAKLYPNELSSFISGSGNDLITDDPLFEAGDKVKITGDLNILESGKNMFTDIVNGPGSLSVTGTIKKGSELTLRIDQKDIKDDENYKHYENGVWNGKWIRGSQLKEVLPSTAFDTGGYTGSWDSSGRLAMLHQKELVLNAYDTENFLAAVNIVRDIAKSIDLQAIAYQHRLAEAVQLTALGETQQALQQDIVIHAEFPNARERTEIEAAFDSLLNRASQFANRKN